MEKITKDIANRAYVERGIEFRHFSSSGRFLFRDSSNRVVRLILYIDDGGTIAWMIASPSPGLLPKLERGRIQSDRDSRRFKSKLLNALWKLGPPSTYNLINPKGQWAIKLFGAIALLFIFAGVKVFFVLRATASFDWFRGSLDNDIVQWQEMMSTLGPGGLSEVFLGSLVFSPAASIACLGVVSFAIFFWTTPLGQDTNDKLTLWGVVTAFGIPLACVMLAVIFLPWKPALLIVSGYLLIGSTLFISTSSVSRLPRWAAAARRYLHSSEGTAGELAEWKFHIGGWKPIQVSNREVAKTVLLHSKRCEEHLYTYGADSDAAIESSLHIAEVGGELLEISERYGGQSKANVWKRVNRRLLVRDRLARIRVFVSGKGLVLLVCVCIVQLAIDPTPWTPAVCVSGKVGYVVSDRPTIFIDESTRAANILSDKINLQPSRSGSCV